MMKKLVAVGAVLAGLFLPPGVLSAGTIFWKAAGRGGTVYMLGSVHVASPGLYPLPDAIEQAFERSEFLVVEANILQNSMDMGLMTTIQEKGLLPEGRTLRDEIPADVYATLTSACAEIGADMENFNGMKPWLAAVNFEQMALMQSGFDPTAGIDLHFLNKASGNKQILELESVNFQLDLIAGLDGELQVSLLKSMVTESRQIKDEVTQVMDYWKQGNGEKIAALANEQFDPADRQSAALFRKLITERNYGMADKIESYLSAGKTYFVVVGAGHLLGKEGIVELLRKKGITVTNQ
jgi:uncharacterized protein YbaP (TraB family)